MFLVVDSITDRYKSQEICDIVASANPCLVVYCPDQYVTTRIRNKKLLMIL